MASIVKKELKETPKMPTLSFKGRASMFSGNKGFFGKVSGQSRFVPPVVRITQNKGGGGK